MTQALLLKMMLGGVAGLLLAMSLDELWRHIKYRRDVHRWQWRATMAENRSSDIMWLTDRFWMIVRLIVAVALASYVAHFLWTTR